MSSSIVDNTVLPAFEAQFFIETLPYGFILLDKQKNFLFWNNIASRLLNLDHSKHKEKAQKQIARLSLGALEIQAPHNKDIYLSLQLQSYHSDQFFLWIQDITHIYRFEKMRQDFVANVSHELRTPLTVFRGYLDLLLSENNISMTECSSALLQMAEQSLRMEGLVNNLLLLSNLESAESDVKKHTIIQIAPLIESIYQDVQSLNQEHQHHFILQLEKNLNIVGAKEELHSAFSNILVNATRYTPNQGTITIRWYAKNKQAHFEVSDTGIGIAPKHINRITQRFYRVDKARSRKHGGTGLGLAIVKHVLLRHQAQLTIQSRLNKGSLFRCSFPI